MKLTDEERLIKPGRALFTVIGLKRIFAPELLQVRKHELETAAKLEPKIHDTIRAFVDGERGSFELPPFDYDETKELLFRELTPDDVDENVAQFAGHPGGDELFHVASTARTFLQGKIPHRLRRVGAFAKEPESAKPSTAELITFRRHLGTVTDPLWAVKQLLTATLGREHMDGLRTVWPDVLAACKRAAISYMADKAEADKKFAPSRRIARQLAVLLEQPGMPNDFVQKLQSTFAAEEEQENNEATRNANTKLDDSLQTTVQKTAQGNA